MRHSRLFAFVFTFLAAALLSGSAFADSMSFNGPGGPNLGGVYTYPYNFTVNGVSTQLMCDTFDNEISSPETWTANENTIATAPASGLFAGGAQAVTNYNAAGVIFDSMLGVNGVSLPGFTNNQDANWAVWALFSNNALVDIETGDASSPFGTAGDPGALAIYNAALTAASTAPSSDFAGITIYTPVSGTQSGNNGTPQEFIGYSPVPEPSELSLLGVLALFTVTGFAFRKRFAFERA